MSLSVLKDVLLFVSDFYEIDLPFKQLFLGAGIQSVCSWRMEPPNQSSKWMIEDTAWGARVPHQQNLEPIVLYTKNSIYQICEVVPAHLWNAPLSFEKKTGYTSDLFHSVCGSFFFSGRDPDAGRELVDQPIGKWNQNYRFQIFFIFIPTWGNDPVWLIFFKWLKPPTRKLDTLLETNVALGAMFVSVMYIPLLTMARSRSTSSVVKRL